MKKFNHRIEKPNSLSNRLLHYLVRRVPLHMRRAILWASVVTAYRKTSSMDDKSIAALNDTLKLCQKSTAIRLPITLSRAIWADIAGAVEVLKSDPTTPAEKASYKQLFVTRIPEWLRYSNDDFIKKDLGTLLDNRGLVGI